MVSVTVGSIREKNVVGSGKQFGTLDLVLGTARCEAGVQASDTAMSVLDTPVRWMSVHTLPDVLT